MKKAVNTLIIIIFILAINVNAVSSLPNISDSNQVDAEIESTIDNSNVSNSETENSPSISYQTHVQSYGWQAWKKDGEMAGTEGEYKRLEGIKININSTIPGSIEYITFVQSYGWQTWKKDGEMAGTEGEYKRLEAIKMRLTGEIAEKYDIYYRVHSQTYGWLGWAKNGETAGTIDQYKRLEAIEIKLITKGNGEKTGHSYIGNAPSISYQTHVQSYGWLNAVSNGNISGTVGQAKRIEAIIINLNNNENLGQVNYSSYIEGVGWEENISTNSHISGTTGQGKNLEAIKISLTDELAIKYDIYYRVHSQIYGWLGWAKNGEIAGTIGYDLRTEAIEIKLVLKGTGEETGNSYLEKETIIKYQAHVQTFGDQEEVSEGEIAGTVGLKKRLEALKINLTSTLTGNIIYKSFGSGGTWDDWHTNNDYTGVAGQAKSMYVICIDLTEQLKEKYDVYYRVHSEKYGWLGWAKNGEMAGATYYDIQAIEIKLYLKNNSKVNQLDTNSHYIETGFYQENGYTYYKDKNGVNANNWITIMNTKYFFNSLGIMIGKNVKKVIDVSAYQKNINWDVVLRDGNIDGVILRIAAGCEREDTYFAKNIAEVKRLNIPYGIYIYSYAENEEEGRMYARFTLDMIKKYALSPTIGIFLDLERNSITSYMGLSNYTDVVNGYMTEMFNNGYGAKTRIYTYKNMAENELNSAYIRQQITWIAQYNNFCTYNGTYIGWQYSSSELIPGISGNVDASVWFADF